MAEKIEGMNIYQIIGRVMEEVGAIGKSRDAKTATGKTIYNFRGIDDVYNALNPVMAKYGIFVCPKILDQKREERRTSNGGVLIYTILTVEFTVFAPDGSNVSMVTIGEGMDSGDKSANKAMSVAMKYAMFQLFMIPTEEMKEMKDPDADVHEGVLPKGAAPKASAQTPPQNPAPAPVQVTTQPTVPKPEEKKASPVQVYLNNEIAFMSQRFEISDKTEMFAKFNAMRKALIEGGVVPNIKSEDMTLDQAKDLVDAIYANFMTDKKEGKTA